MLNGTSGSEIRSVLKSSPGPSDGQAGGIGLSGPSLFPLLKILLLGPYRMPNLVTLHMNISNFSLTSLGRITIIRPRVRQLASSLVLKS